MKKVSLITPLRNEDKLLQRGLQDLESFIRKFPLDWELLLVIDPSQDQTLSLANSLRSEKIQIQVLENSRRRGRGRSVLRGLEKATGDYVMVFPLDFTIPLADLISLLQELISDPSLDLVIGNRHTSRKKREAPFRTSWHWTLEKIIGEKLKSAAGSFQDSLCPYWGIQKKALERVLPNLKFKAWYYTPELLKAASALQFKIQEVAILSRDPRTSQIPILKEYLRNLF
jgi:glycosyltransferase involved in cell wall biosynthesis